MIDQIKLDFIQIIASISATLMGFAFLTPIFQKLSTGIYTRAGEIIDGRILLKLILIITSLPLFMFFWPFLNSLLLIFLTQSPDTIIISESTETVIKGISILLALGGLGVFLWIKIYLKLDNTGGARIFYLFPFVVFGLYLVYASIAILFHYTFISFINATNLLFIISGLLFILYSLTISIEKSVKFKTFHMIQSRSGEKGFYERVGFYEQVKADFKRMDEALRIRKHYVERLKELFISKSRTNELNLWRFRVAKYESELWFLQKEFKYDEDGFEGLSQRWDKFKKSGFTLTEIFDFEDDYDMAINYLIEFERTNQELGKVIEGLDSMSGSHGASKCVNFYFSVVIPTRGHPNLIKKLLISLQKAIINSEKAVEIIIIDDSPLPEQEEIESLCEQYGAQYLRGSSSVREKRNYGIEKSKGEIIFFTDSDCEVSPNIFNEHLKVYTEENPAGVLGLTEFIGKDSISWNIINKTIFVDSFSSAKTLSKDLDSAPWGTCTNLSIKKDVLEDVGKFETNFPFRLGGDDTELGVRINEAGYKIKMNPDAIVFHTRETWSNVYKVAKKAFRWGRVEFHILKKHPQLGYIGFPNFLTVFLLISLVSLLGLLTDHGVITIMTTVIWTSSTLLIESTIKVRRAKEKPPLIFFRLIAKLLDLIFEAGTIFESVKRGNLSMLYKRIVYTPAQLIFEWENEVLRSYSIIIGLLLTVIIMWSLKGV